MPTPPSELDQLLPGRVSTDPHELASYARDLWPLSTVRFRDGERFDLPSAVVRPKDVEEVGSLLRWCSERSVCVLPYGGGSGVCGGVLVDPAALAGRPAVALDLKGLSGVEVDRTNLRVTAYAGTLGMDYESALQSHGLTGGHYPQSLYPSTVGGWLACRSAGQASTGYGRGEDLVAGVDVVTASGDLVTLRPQPATAAGPDLMRLFCGSEGTLGVIVRATMRVFNEPDQRRFRAVGYDGFLDGIEGVRTMIQSGIRPEVVRLYDPDDAAFAFPDAGGSVLVCVYEGPLAVEREAASIPLLGGRDLGEAPARHWTEHRFDGAYRLAEVLRTDGLLGPGIVADTMEVAGSWSALWELYVTVRDALSHHCLAVLCHMSHVYPDGACLYFTFALGGDEDRYRAVWEAGMEATLACSGTITHHHGVGRLKAAWLRRELGPGGWEVLVAVKNALDPAGILNPGNLGLGH